MKTTAVLCFLVLLAATPVRAAQPTSFAVVMEHYEPIRQALLADSTEGVAGHARAIVTELKALQADFSHDRVGATHEALMVVREKLPAMIEAAEALAEAGAIESARTAFYQLSVPLVRWQEGMPEGSSRPVVVYCPMHKRSWLQPGDKVGNPYGDMPGCGTIVSR